MTQAKCFNCGITLDGVGKSMEELIEDLTIYDTLQLRLLLDKIKIELLRRKADYDAS